MSNVNVIKVWFYDWSENYVESNVWKHWNEWYVVKELLERGVDNGEDEKQFHNDAVTDWKDFLGLTIDGKVEGMVVSKAGNLIMDVWCDLVSEFGVMVFNVDEFKKLDGKVVKIKKDGVGGWSGWEVVEDDGSIKWEGIYKNGEVKSDVEWMIESDEDYSVFRLVEWKGY